MAGLMVGTGAALVTAIAAAAPAAAAAAGAPPPSAIDVPADAGPQQVQVVERVFPAGGGSGWHTHPGLEIGTVTSGETEMQLADGTTRRYRAGETFIIGRGIVHQGVNAGREPARLSIVYIVDKGRPVRAEAAAPGR